MERQGFPPLVVHHSQTRPPDVTELGSVTSRVCNGSEDRYIHRGVTETSHIDDVVSRHEGNQPTTDERTPKVGRETTAQPRP